MKKVKRYILSVLCMLCMFCSLPVAAKGKPQPKKLVLSRKEILLYVGETKRLSVEKTKPQNASAKAIWSSRKSRVATVSPKGLVTAKREGKTSIVAVSKKNPKAVASVNVIVKKRPKKAEKECSVTADTYLRRGCEAGSVIRNREDLEEILKDMVRRRNYKSYRDALRRAPLAAYRNMDFEKETLVLLETYHKETDITSCRTRLDADGKLRAVITIPYKKQIDDGRPRPTEVVSYILALRLSKKDAAMIDEYVLDYQEIP